MATVDTANDDYDSHEGEKEEEDDFLNNIYDFANTEKEPPRDRRQECIRCGRPVTVCWCPFLPHERIQTETTVYILQHPFEELRKLKTAPMLKLSLHEDKCHIIRGKKINGVKRNIKYPDLVSILQLSNTVLLFPGEDAQDISDLPPLDQPYNLVVLDGTWTQAKGMYINMYSLFCGSRLIIMVCLVDIRYFPFDVQHCSFEYYIANENSSSVILNNHIGTDLSVFTENAEWKLIANDVVIREKHGKNFVELRYTLKRRGDFIMFTVVAPLFMLSFLNGCVFIVPIDSGEKGSFAITVFLSYFVFVTIIMDTLPHNSLNVSMFIIYIVCLLSVSVLLVLYSIVQSKMFHACGENECPFKWMQSRGVKRLPEKERPLFTWTAFLGRLDIYLFAGFLAVVSLFSAVFTIGIALRL